MKDFYTVVKELVDSGDNSAVIKAARQFGISTETASNRFKTYFGKTARECIRDARTPSKEKCDLYLMMSNDVSEFKELTNLGNNSVYFKGLFDRYYGVSNFNKAKATLISKQPCEMYIPTIADNRSIFLSQYYGDGSYDLVRNSIRIEHGYKQAEYLAFKVSLFNKAFPTTNGLENIRKSIRESTGYVSYTWYSGKLPNNYRECHKEFSQMTPLGVFLFFLDDGCYHISKSGQHIISLCLPNPEIKQQAYEYFKTYGIDFTFRDSELVLQDSVKVAMFMNCFTKPFLHMVPDCMKYKCEMKI